jgi:ParB family chromosome partitioning protein
VAKRGLGRGIDALLQTNAQGTQQSNRSTEPLDGFAGLEALPGSRVAMVNRSQLYGNPGQPRKDFEPQQLQELADSIKEKGILQPILVEQDDQGKYMIIAGERRFRASGLAGLDEIPVIIREFSDAERLEIALIENIQRENLTPLEEARAYKELLDQFGLSQEEVAKKVGKSRSVIANALRMLRLPEEIQIAIAQGGLSPGHARAVLAVSTGEESQLSFFHTIMEFDLTVREAESLSKLINQGLTARDGIPQIRVSGRGSQPDTSQSSEDITELSIRSEQDILDLAKGARIISAKDEPKPTPLRNPELWDMEEELIKTLGTKVEIKGTEKAGKIEISYYSMEDLERVFDLIHTKQKS